MINLLPSETRENRLYGRRNRQLVRWCIAALLAAIGIVGIAAGGYVFLTRSEASAASEKTRVETQIAQDQLDKVLAEYNSFTADLKTVVQILSKQILFSELIQQIGSVVPPGTTLNTVSISNKDNALSLDFTLDQASSAPTLQLNLEDPENALFEKADIIQLSCQTDDVTRVQTCSAQVRVLLKKDAPYYFLNSVKAAP